MITEIQGSLGRVTHYYKEAGVAVVKLEPGAKLKKGDHVHFQGHTTNFDQDVESLQIEHHDVRQVKAGDNFGLKVRRRVRENDFVYVK